MLFISHANPEDNEFAQWLALRLASEGYPVWCDLTQLLGGEAFWEDAENAIRSKSAKMLFVLSRTSNRKPGCLDELEIARKVQRAGDLNDFIIPLWIDDLPTVEFNVHLTRLTAIPFRAGWHVGLAQLLKKLERDNVAQDSKFSPGAVASWWRERSGTKGGVRLEAEELTTNLHKLVPFKIYFHRLTLALADAPIEQATATYPAERFEKYLVSFAPAEDLLPTLGTGVGIAATEVRTLGASIANLAPRLWGFRDERAVLTKLLNRAWGGFLTTRGFSTHQFATGSPALYFQAGMIDGDRVRFRTHDGSMSHRQMIGYHTVRRTDGSSWLRYWHFALEARPTSTPAWGYIMKPHVLFSEDGKSIWSSDDRLARARRSQCRGWWNDRWRDLNAAAVQFLADGKDTITLPVGSSTQLEIQARALGILSPVSYDEASIGDDQITDAVVEEPNTEEFESLDDPEA